MWPGKLDGPQGGKALSSPNGRLCTTSTHRKISPICSSGWALANVRRQAHYGGSWRTLPAYHDQKTAFRFIGSLISGHRSF